jgi:hypothetical protein
MTAKTKRIISIILTGIPALVLIIGGVSKIIGTEPEPVVEFLTKLGFREYFIPVGITSLIIAALLLYPKTVRIGFLSAICYFSGALSLEIAGKQPLVSAVFLILLWTGMFLRDKGMFFSFQK